MPRTIMTIGYEGVAIDRFFQELRSSGVQYLVDVRQMPLSRKPGFSKTALAAHTENHGLQYVHMVNLGCPKAIRRDYQADGDWERYTKRFLEYLDTQDAALDDLAFLVRKGHCALLCFEADPDTCHRKYVAEAVRDRIADASVTHLMPTIPLRVAHAAAA